MTLQTLNYVVVIAKYKSFSQAAKKLYMSQSTLSAAVRDLENELGIHLFIRNNRGVELTLEGEDFLTYAKDILDRSNLLALRYRNEASANTHFSVSTQHLPFAVRAFHELIAERSDNDSAKVYEVAIRETATNNVIYDVSTGKSEVGVLAISETHLPLLEKTFQKYRLDFEEVASLDSYVFMRKQHPLADRESLSLEDLKEYPFVTYDQADAPGYFTEETLVMQNFEQTIHVTDRASKMLMIRNSDAFSIGVDLPNFNTDVYFARKATEMVAIPFVNEGERTITGYIHQHDHIVSEICDRYIEVLRDEIAKLELPQK